MTNNDSLLSTKSILIKLKKNIKLFKNLSMNEIAFFIAKGIKIRIPSSTTLFEENSKGTDFYILLDGEINVSIFQNNSKEEKKIVNKINTMHIVGEIGALLGIRRTASIDCSKDCIFLKFNKRVFDDIEDKNPVLTNKIYKNIILILVEDYLIPLEKKL